MGGRYTNETGYLQVNIDGTWGSICGNNILGMPGWFNATSAAARVACRQLGLPWTTASAFTAASSTGQVGPGTNGSLPFLLTSVGCSGHEARLLDCMYYKGLMADGGDCSGNDAGVCRGEGLRKCILWGNA